ncbi:hypothetical protein H257_06838 [Aphanomyces astaci]|uniref:Uncharacterized protein n=1 Tax=Aphanomyces astaci TaxID=112090 RepID=W4GL16_APHAT|nr:hypothetical protein H257_06838 [Aphanomyces astaci]ETV79578.1 hypothetical protein H257_06838 [Aphanomyces astaci]|eukprot:XP_009830514.1 hypothetical protein H257_06838 [Aphanomyces astaci]
MQADLCMTTGLPIQNTTKTQNFAVPFYRVYSKSYCTSAVVQGFNMVVVTKSISVPSSTHYLGLMFRRSIYSTIGAVLKYVTILIGMAGFLASRKTVQWHDRSPDKVESVTEKLMDMVVPKYFSHQSFAMTFDLFCYNSDLLVLLFVVSNLLDMNQAIQYIREVNAYNALSPQWDMTVKLFALSTRLLWLNVGLVKLAKMTVHFVSSATYSGHSRVMSWLNFSSVTTLYLSAILLYFVPDYIEYNNICRWDIANSLESINGSVIDSFKSFYFRGAPAIGIGLALNVAGVLAVDHLVLIKFWRNLAKNSLRAPSHFQHHVHHVAVLECKARRLSTLQWYFMSQTMCFGLPEKELSKQKQSGNPTLDIVTTKGDESSIHLREQGKGDIFHVINQSDSGHVHLLDDQLVDVKSLAFNIKILRNTALYIC